MKFTYKTYLFYKDIEKYSDKIEIVKMERMDLGAMVTFHCDDKKVLDEIFGGEE
jgi:hypothetical protein